MGWLRNPFRRRPAAPRPGDGPHPDSAEDWQPGDLAECIYPGPWYPLDGRTGPKKGDIRLVKAVERERGYQFLSFNRFTPQIFQARGFRKVKLDPDRQFRREAEFVPVELIAPKRETQDA